MSFFQKRVGFHKRNPRLGSTLLRYSHLIDDVCLCFSLQSGQSAIDEPLKISSSFLYSDLVSVSDPLHSFYGFQNQTGNGNGLNEFDEHMAPR